MKKRFTEEQVIGFLREAEAGLPVKELPPNDGDRSCLLRQRARPDPESVPASKRGCRNLACAAVENILMNDLKKQFSELTTEYLLQMRARGDGLTEEAHTAIEEIITERGERLPARPQKPIVLEQRDEFGKFFGIAAQRLFIVLAGFVGLVLSKVLSGTWVGYLIALLIVVVLVLIWQWYSRRAPEEIQEERNKKIIKEEGLTELMMCAANGDMGRIRELTEYGVDLNARSNSGTTALMYAARNNQVQVLKFLLGSGANPALKSENGMTAKDIARRFGNVEAEKCFD